MIAIIFDMDGVIIDSEPLHMRLEDELFNDLGLGLDVQARAAFLGVSNRDMWQQLKRDHHLSQSVEELIELGSRRYRDAVATEKVPYVPGAVELIRELHARGVPVAIASSSASGWITKTVADAGLEDAITVFVGGDQVAKSKPDPEIFLRAAAGLTGASSSSGDPETDRFIVIEDSPNGVRAAKAAGLYCIGFANPNSGSPDLHGTDRVCSSMEEVGRVLNELITDHQRASGIRS